ncbi:hypothetical protein BH10PSE17_BH10PSE17_38180 [soil metagenome]
MRSVLALASVACACLGSAAAQAQQRPGGPGGGGPPGGGGGGVPAGGPADANRQRPAGVFEFRPFQNLTLPSGSRATPARYGPFLPTQSNERDKYVPAPLSPAAKDAATAATRSDDVRRPGKMSDQERRELRQNIEDAGKDVYRPRP